mmetsp:Transcript_60965/g.145281  ORF Transcript_60965/g.145281 Transcript_60965/m.145281 type:complete len:255 (-) Transcript_60965:27-791(-)
MTAGCPAHEGRVQHLQEQLRRIKAFGRGEVAPEAKATQVSSWPAPCPQPNRRAAPEADERTSPGATEELEQELAWSVQRARTWAAHASRFEPRPVQICEEVFEAEGGGEVAEVEELQEQPLVSELIMGKLPSIPEGENEEGSCSSAQASDESGSDMILSMMSTPPRTPPKAPTMEQPVEQRRWDFSQAACSEMFMDTEMRPSSSEGVVESIGLDSPVGRDGEGGRSLFNSPKRNKRASNEEPSLSSDEEMPMLE